MKFLNNLINIFGDKFLIGSKSEKPQIELRDATGKTWSIEVERISMAQRSKDFARLAAFSWKLLPGNIAYVALNSFIDDTAAKEYVKNFPEISKAKAIIFDIRNNQLLIQSVNFASQFFSGV